MFGLLLLLSGNQTERKGGRYSQKRTPDFFVPLCPKRNKKALAFEVITIRDLSHMVCRPHQYILNRMAMPAYQARQEATQLYAPFQPRRFYQGESLSQSKYAPAILPPANYNSSTAALDLPLFLPARQSASLVNENKEEVTARGIKTQTTRAETRPTLNFGLYSLPVKYEARCSVPAVTRDDQELRNELSQLIQQELQELNVRVQHV